VVDQAHKPEPTEYLPLQLHKYYYAIDKVAHKVDLCNNHDKSNVVEQ